MPRCIVTAKNSADYVGQDSDPAGLVWQNRRPLFHGLLPVAWCHAHRIWVGM
jgi:hypothetical protein